MVKFVCLFVCLFVSGCAGTTHIEWSASASYKSPPVEVKTGSEKPAVEVKRPQIGAPYPFGPAYQAPR